MADGGRAVLAALARPLLLVAGLAAAGWALRDLPIHHFAEAAGRLGDVSFLLLGAIACAVGLPRQVVAFAGGYAHGAWLGFGLALAAQLLGCLADLLWARLVARSWVQGRFGGRFGSGLARLDAFLAANPFRATLTLRLLPVGNNLVLNLLAGAFGVRVGAFLAASAIGYVPQTVVFVLLGKGIRIARGVEVAIALATLLASTALGLALKARPGAPPVTGHIIPEMPNTQSPAGNAQP